MMVIDDVLVINLRVVWIFFDANWWKLGILAALVFALVFIEKRRKRCRTLKEKLDGLKQWRPPQMPGS